MAVQRIMAAVRRDAQRFVTKGGFSAPVTITSPGGATASINALIASHTEFYDTDGNGVNSNSTTISIMKSDLATAGYPYLNDKFKLALENHKIAAADIDENASNWVITEMHPNGSTGVIVLVLGRVKVR